MNTNRYVYFRSKKDYKYTPEYYAWRNMKSRCYTKSSNQYEDYGGRGIKVCDRWLNSFENFLADMGKKPDGFTLDRKDVNGDYSLENCKWSNYSTQNHNQRKRATNKSGYRGVSLETRTKKYIATIWKNYTMIYLGSNVDAEQAALLYDAAAVQLYGRAAQTNLLRA